MIFSYYLRGICFEYLLEFQTSSFKFFVFSSVYPVGGSNTLRYIPFTFFEVQTHSYSLLIIPFSLAVMLSYIATSAEVILWSRYTFLSWIPKAFSHVYDDNFLRVASYNSKFTVIILFRFAHSNSQLTG